MLTVYIVVIAFIFSLFFALCHLFITALGVEFALNCLVFCEIAAIIYSLLSQVIRLFELVVIVALLWRSRALFVCYLFFATVTVEFVLGRLVFY